MAMLRVRQSIETTGPQLRIETSVAPPRPSPADVTLQPGVHRFQLVVEDDEGNRSAPAIAEVLVTEVIDEPRDPRDPRDPRGPRIDPRDPIDPRRDPR